MVKCLGHLVIFDESVLGFRQRYGSQRRCIRSIPQRHAGATGTCRDDSRRRLKSQAKRFSPEHPNRPFNGNAFLFVSEDGTISGWRGGPSEPRLRCFSSSDPTDVYKGTTLDTTGGHSYLLSANFRTGTIDVLKGDAWRVGLGWQVHRPRTSLGVRPAQRRDSERESLCHLRLYRRR